MKSRIIVSLTFILSMIIGCQFYNASTALAADVYVTDELYVQTHLIKEDFDNKEFTVPFKMVLNGKLLNNRLHTFRYASGKWYIKQTNAVRNWDLVNDYYTYQKAFDACIPYCKLAQQYPR